MMRGFFAVAARRSAALEIGTRTAVAAVPTLGSEIRTDTARYFAAGGRPKPAALRRLRPLAERTALIAGVSSRMTASGALLRVATLVLSASPEHPSDAAFERVDVEVELLRKLAHDGKLPGVLKSSW